ncbi:hypothetical protein Taro_007735 [Colocasia esculenta]|uniref:Uncharacterized protein n=1 Tax=Colocasia esculenta TaxID=4460 RepID=A0A843U1A1_COLES|nr:hypothetical protein [Colocasia esculenta]
MQSAAVDAAVYIGYKASQQTVKHALLGHETTRGWAKSLVYRLGVKDMDIRGPLEERVIQLSATSLDSESGSTPISTEEAFVSVIKKVRSGRIRCRGSRETHRTWYGREGPSSSDYQQHQKYSQNGG